MRLWRAFLPMCMVLLSTAANAATEIGAITLVEGEVLLLRGATWYKVAAGLRVEEADILASGDKSQAQIELATGTIANLAGMGSLYFAPSPATAPRMLMLPNGWLKAAVKAPGVRVRAPAFDAVTADGTFVMHAQAAAAEVFVESGSLKLYEVTTAGTDGTARDVKRGEYGGKSATVAYASVARAPKKFVDAMPRHFIDPLPVLAGRVKTKPQLVADHDITYAEAEPWLAGRDRSVFERRFASRLRDPVFRKAVEPNVARYPLWDRMLHPEKYLPKPAPVAK